MWAHRIARRVLFFNGRVGGHSNERWPMIWKMIANARDAVLHRVRPLRRSHPPRDRKDNEEKNNDHRQQYKQNKDAAAHP
jgi:hypothetical protein